MLTDDSELGRAMIDLYRVVYSDECAVSFAPSGLVLNPACPIVREHVCVASQAVITLDLQVGRRAHADAIRELARSQWRCGFATP